MLFRLEEIILIVLRVLVNVALITLLERKVLSIRQFRVGPNKIGAYGFLQPVADAVKLFSNRNESKQVLVTVRTIPRLR